MAYQSWSVVFGEQPSAAKWNILGSNDAYFDSLIGSGTAWTSYTPSFANITIGSGTVAGRYQTFGKTTLFEAQFIYGAGSAVGASPTVSYPLTSATYATFFVTGNASLLDSGTNVYSGTILHASTTTAGIYAVNASGTYSVLTALNATIPFTWAANDSIFIQGIIRGA